ncbi:3D domain-containing protein [Marinilactibacillus sp. Marseille-P9653]|uniref:3D domain-containing protein n=1 Tax=Marinilactibacillus sp. Marseille-P9653 TaxID=2866583 RepID=UPI001CE4B60D|nr:3D domain-containing protein [Marinilactibacillus sp. Marseille-P9653]
MKKWITGFAVLALGLTQLLTTQVVSADSLDDIRQQQEQKKSDISTIQRDIAKALEETSTLSEEIEKLNEEISEKEVTIQNKEVEIGEQEKLVEARLEQAGARLQSLQKSEATNNVVKAILEAESLADLFNRTLVVMQLTDAGNQQIEEAQIEADTLAEMQVQLVTEKEALNENLTLVSEQKSSYDEKLSALETLVKDNQSQLTQLENKEADELAKIEEARQAAREEAMKAAEELAAKEAEAQEEAIVSTSSSKPETTKEETVEAAEVKPEVKEEAKTEKPAESTSSNGRTVQVSATGYSTQQANLSTHTATGIDLRVNPRVIAVDPSVIPLGSTVEIPGKGIYIAGDTGGAIKGNKIDIHFSTVSEAFAWGRKNITVKILN